MEYARQIADVDRPPGNRRRGLTNLCRVVLPSYRAGLEIERNQPTRCRSDEDRAVGDRSRRLDRLTSLIRPEELELRRQIRRGNPGEPEIAPELRPGVWRFRNWRRPFLRAGPRPRLPRVGGRGGVDRQESQQGDQKAHSYTSRAPTASKGRGLNPPVH